MHRARPNRPSLNPTALQVVLQGLFREGRALLYLDGIGKRNVPCAGLLPGNLQILLVAGKLVVPVGVVLAPDGDEPFELRHLVDTKRALYLGWPEVVAWPRSEEHTSELQSQSNLVCRLLL